MLLQKTTKRETTAHNTQHRKLKAEQQESDHKTGVISSVPER